MPAPTKRDEDTGCLVFGDAIADVTGGATVDAEARTALNAVLAVLRSAGLIQQD